MLNLFKEPSLGILVFSAIETVAVIAWFALLTVNPLLAAGVLFAGYVVEHVVAFNVGKDRPYLSFPRR